MTTADNHCSRCGGKQSIVVEYPGVRSVEPCPVCSPHEPGKMRDTFATTDLHTDGGSSWTSKLPPRKLTLE